MLWCTVVLLWCRSLPIESYCAVVENQRHWVRQSRDFIDTSWHRCKADIVCLVTSTTVRLTSPFF